MAIFNWKLNNSLSYKVMFVFLLFSLPLISLLIYNNLYAIGVVRNQVAQSNKHFINLYMKQIDSNLLETDSYLYNMAVQEPELLNLMQLNLDNNQPYNLSKIRLSQKISNDINNYKLMDAFFFYSAVNDEFAFALNSEIPYEERESINTDLKPLLSAMEQTTPSPDKRWVVRKAGNEYYVCHIVKNGTVYIGAWVRVSKLMEQLNLVDLGQNGVAILANEYNEPMNDTGFIQEHGIDLSFGNASYQLIGQKEKFLSVGEKSAMGSFNLIALLPDRGILERLPLLQRIVLFIPIGTTFILLLLLIFLRKMILLPIYRIVKAMRKIQDGIWDTHIPRHSSSKEFQIMDETFNAMVMQIEKLKIDVYEEKLISQKAELNHLQLQINPHFFLNSLNIIYTLAQVKNFSLIQEMSLCLVEYFRFMFRSNLTVVALDDEMKHVQNYLRIQELRFPAHLTYTINLPESLKACSIPPLIVQSFVENTIKHAVTLDEHMHIQINIDSGSREGKLFLCIHISDSGKGFAQNVLEELQEERDLANEQGEHIGIWNVRRRLRLLYQDHAHLRFYNGSPNGANVELTVPLNK